MASFLLISSSSSKTSSITGLKENSAIISEGHIVAVTATATIDVAVAGLWVVAIISFLARANY